MLSSAIDVSVNKIPHNLKTRLLKLKIRIVNILEVIPLVFFFVNSQDLNYRIVLSPALALNCETK